MLCEVGWIIVTKVFSRTFFDLLAGNNPYPSTNGLRLFSRVTGRDTGDLIFKITRIDH